MNKKSRKLSHKALEKELIKIFEKAPDKLYTINMLKSKLSITNSKGSVRAVIEKLINKHFLFEVKNGHYRLDRYAEHPPKPKGNKKDSTRTFVAVIDRTKNGTAYAVTDDENQEDIHISQKRLGWALHGDTAIVKLVKSRRKKPEGEVVEILKRRTNQFIGKLSRYKNQSEVAVDDGKIPFYIKVNNSDIKDAGHKENVLVEITQWPRKGNQLPMGKVLDTLGSKSTNDIEMKSILLKYGFDVSFPSAVLNEAKQFKDVITKQELAQRRDMRDVTTFTIDPATAKDFDDALSLKRYEDGTYEVGIHIADVAHFVREGTALDKEAYKRSTSVYLVDRVSPMLPETLSNDLCSLRPHVDRYTFSAVITFDANHKIIKRWFGRAVINSDARLSYEEAQEAIDEGAGEFSFEIQFLNGVSQRLRKKRFQEGSINFESDEVEFKLDEEGKPIDIYIRERLPAHQLIEDLMLLANREVAIFIHKKSKKAAAIPFIYRIHDEPDMEKVLEFSLFAKELGVKLDVQNAAQIPAAFNRITTEIQDKELAAILQPLAIRTMAKAEYSTENIGHFGLGFEYYTHFTSPIRRYSDILVHRILSKNIDGEYRVDEKELQRKAQHISAQERNAMDAERESVKYKQAEFLQNSIGKTFPGVVSGMIDRGFFVELVDSLAEGLVDWYGMAEEYVLDDNRLRARSRDSGNVIAMGTKVKVRIEKVNLDRREVDMSFVGLRD